MPTAVPPPTLEAILPLLRELDQHRDRAQRLRNALAEFIRADAGASRYIERLRHPDPERLIVFEDPEILADAPGDLIEQALIGMALKTARPGVLPADSALATEVTQRLQTISLNSLFTVDLPNAQAISDAVPLLRAARALQCLATTPGSVLCPAALACHFRIVYELYSAAYPDWTTGGASASDDAPSTAFMTNECVRALHALRTALETTAQLADEMAWFRREHDLATRGRLSRLWRDSYRRRIVIATHLRILPLLADTLFDLGPGTLSGTPEIEDWLLGLPQRMRTGMADDILGACSLQDALEAVRKSVDDPQRSQYHHFSNDAWAKASQTHDVFMKAMRAARQHLGDGSSDSPPDWAAFSRVLCAEADNMRLLLRPTERYLSTVLDRELASHHPEIARTVDCGELTCAAVGYGSVTNDWTDPRLRLAAAHLTMSLSHRGEFPVGRPFHTGPQGYLLHPVSMELIRGYCQLLKAVGHPLDPETIARLLRRFDRLQPGHCPEGTRALLSEGSGYPQRISWWTTSLGVIAAHGLVELLDEHINHEVGHHFTADPRASAPLDELIAGDIAFDEMRKAEGRAGVLDVFAQMRAHVLGVRGAELPRWTEQVPKALWSVVLHGPPGTGKTSLSEALAASTRARHITVTPSDIVSSGADRIEASARIVFEALGLLTRAVILFDEFDQVLWNREDAEQAPVDFVFKLLTPGMLPKLRELHDRAKEHRVAYVLATNRLEDLDDAAIRQGRFDSRVGVYPPDPVSRAGAAIYALDTQDPPPVFTHEQLLCLYEMLLKTEMAPISLFASGRWGSGPRKVPCPRSRPELHIDLVRNTPLAHLHRGTLGPIREMLQLDSETRSARGWAPADLRQRDASTTRSTARSNEIRELLALYSWEASVSASGGPPMDWLETGFPTPA